MQDSISPNLITSDEYSSSILKTNVYKNHNSQKEVEIVTSRLYTDTIKQMVPVEAFTCTSLTPFSA